jgi:capsular polysaccharide biosynthesis protein
MEEFDFKFYLQALIRGKWIILGFLLLSILAGSLMTIFTQPIYAASSKVLLSRLEAKRYLSHGLLNNLFKSDDYLDHTIKELKLDFSKEQLKESISVNPVDPLVIVTAYHPEPKRAAQIANSLAGYFVSDVNESQDRKLMAERIEALKDEIFFFNQQEKAVLEDLKTAESIKAVSSLEKLEKLANVSTVRTQLLTVRRSISSLKKELYQTELTYLRSETKLKSVASIPKSPVRPDLKIYVGLSLLAGLVVGMVLVLSLASIQKKAF